MERGGGVGRSSSKATKLAFDTNRTQVRPQARGTTTRIGIHHLRIPNYMHPYFLPVNEKPWLFPVVPVLLMFYWWSTREV